MIDSCRDISVDRGNLAAGLGMMSMFYEAVKCGDFPCVEGYMPKIFLMTWLGNWLCKVWKIPGFLERSSCVRVYSSISPETLTRSSTNESANSLKSSGGRAEGGGGGTLWTLGTNVFVSMKH